MEVVSPQIKYFVTPTQNIVRGVVEGGKVTNAEFFVNKRNEYSTPSQLNQLMKERTNLSLGKIELKEISRPNFTDYDIPIDAGKPRRKPTKKSDIDTGIAAGKKKVKKDDESSHKKKVSAGEVELDVEAGVRRGRKKVVGGEVELDVEAGAKRGRSKSKPKAPKKTSRSKSRSKKIDAGAVEGKKDDKISLADLFKHVSLNLANQTSAIIAQGGNPSELLKEDIKFFSKQ